MLKFEGNTFFSQNFLLAGHRPFKNAENVEIFIKNILDKYSNVGFPFCSIRPEFIYIDSITTKLILHISEGERVIIKDYLFKTDGKTEIAPLRRIARVSKDQYFSLRNINQIKKAISKTDVFSNITGSILKKGDNYYLLFELKEKSADYIMAAGSFAQANNYLSIDFYSLNVFGSLRQFQFRYEANISGENNKKLFQINFTEPIVLNPVTFNTELSLWTYDSARLTEFNGKFIAPLNNYVSIILSSGVEMANYLTDTGNYNYTHTLLSTGLQSDYNKNDFTIINNIAFDYLFRENERLRIKYDGVFEFANFFVKPHYRMVRTDFFEYFDYIRLGGANNLRGYMEDEFLSKQSCWLNIEYKILPIFPLVDIARIDNDYTYSYGVGIDAKTNFANTSIIFAWPKRGKWNDGKVHLLLEKGF